MYVFNASNFIKDYININSKLQVSLLLKVIGILCVELCLSDLFQ
jgi:hypothetical protein